MFTSFVICLDILSHKLNLDKRKIKCAKCNEEINYTHDCEEPLLRDAYAVDYLKELGLDEEKARKFNRLRNAIFHGRKTLSKERIDEILDLNNTIREFLLLKFRKTLQLQDNEPPNLPQGSIMVQDMALGLYADIDQQTFDIIKENMKNQKKMND